MRQEEVSPFLHRDVKHVAQYTQARNAREEGERRDRYMARVTCERLLHKKWDRSGALRQRIIQRLGDHGRKYSLVYVLLAYLITYALRRW